jgi:hypothetical protein
MTKEEIEKIVFRNPIKAIPHYLFNFAKKEKNQIGVFPLNFYYLEQKYDIDRFEVLDMLDWQGNSCAICESTFSEENKPNLDHCHETAENAYIRASVRGFLCHDCNLIVGLVEKNRKLANEKIKEYLDTPPSAWCGFLDEGPYSYLQNDDGESCWDDEYE